MSLLYTKDFPRTNIIHTTNLIIALLYLLNNLLISPRSFVLPQLKTLQQPIPFNDQPRASLLAQNVYLLPSRKSLPFPSLSRSNTDARPHLPVARNTMTVPATKLTSPFPWKPRDLAVYRNNSQSTDSSTYSTLLTPRHREPTSIPASNMRVGACKLSATAFSAFDALSTHLVVQVDLAPRRRHAAGLGHIAAELERTPRAERERAAARRRPHARLTSQAALHKPRLSRAPLQVESSCHP